MKLPVVAASLFVAATAYAQAPAEYEEASGAPGMAEPVPVVPTPEPPRPRRWSVGLGIGSLDLAPHSAPDAKTQFGVGQIAVRYLATRHLEIELAFAGGREQLEDGNEGDQHHPRALPDLGAVPLDDGRRRDARAQGRVLRRARKEAVLDFRR